MSEALRELGEHVAGRLEQAVTGWRVAWGELTVEVVRDRIVEVLTFLRDDAGCRFNQLVDLCGLDWPARPLRLEVAYHLLSLTQNQRIRVKLATDPETPVPSVSGLFPVADWFEREAFDMYGIVFDGHPDLRRLLTDYGFDGFPLRKDFPLTGHVQARYDEQEKRVVYEPVTLVQEFRDFEFMSPWEGAKQILPGDEKAKP